MRRLAHYMDGRGLNTSENYFCLFLLAQHARGLHVAQCVYYACRGVCVCGGAHVGYVAVVPLPCSVTVYVWWSHSRGWGLPLVGRLDWFPREGFTATETCWELPAGNIPGVVRTGFKVGH